MDIPHLPMEKCGLCIRNVLDDFQYTMSEQFMKDAFEKGFDKFTRIGKFSYDIINAGLQMRSDINFIILTHSDEENNNDFDKSTAAMLAPFGANIVPLCFDLTSLNSITVITWL